MIVTHMRKVTLKVRYQVPQGTELTRLTKKTAVSYIYIGKPAVGSDIDKAKTHVPDGLAEDPAAMGAAYDAEIEAAGGTVEVI